MRKNTLIGRLCMAFVLLGGTVLCVLAVLGIRRIAEEQE